MDTELLRTFLEVNRTRHFGRAAANLYLTQSAVSSRIRILEQIVGVSLFSRGRNDIQLTAEGRKLVKHAETILTAWTRARQEIAVEDEGKTSLTIGMVTGLSAVLLEDWIAALRAELSTVVLNAEVLDVDTMQRRLTEKTLDVALAFDPPNAPSLKVVDVAKVRFVMVSTDPVGNSIEAIGNAYVLVNWGSWFTVLHAKHFPDLPPPTVRLDLGRLAHQLIIKHGGSAYLAETMVEEDLSAGRLHRVPDAPELERATYAAYAAESENRGNIERALGILSSIVGVG